MAADASPAGPPPLDDRVASRRRAADSARRELLAEPRGPLCERPAAQTGAVSVEPGVYLYLAGRFGARIEDIVAATDAGPRPLDTSSHALTVVG